jgi:CubicO group peptidase (beta-lactamase class C family)
MKSKTFFILAASLVLLLSIKIFFDLRALKGLSGTWQGTLDVGITSFRMALVLQKGEDGKPAALFNNVDDGLYSQSFQKFSLQGRSFHGELPTGEVLDLSLNWRGNLQGIYTQAHGSFQKEGKVSSLVLKRGGSFLVPRMSREGGSQTTYQYQEPLTLSDGWETAPLPKEADVKKVENGIRKILDQTFPHIHNLTVVKGGKLVLDEYFYGYGPEDEHPAQSITKSVFSMLVGIARDQGFLKLEDRLYDAFPEYRSKPGWDRRKDLITLRNLLTMTSGFACDDWKDSQSCSWGMVDSSDWLAFALSQPLGHAPGQHFAYCGACLTPFSALLARKSGMDLAAFAQKNLFNPLGIKEPSWIKVGGEPTPASFGLGLRPRDLAKLGYLYMRKGHWSGRQVISEKWVEESTGIQISQKRTNREADYGYLWWEKEVPFHGKKIRIFYAWGVGGQYLFVVPELELVCVVTGGNYKNGKLGANSLKLFEENVLAAFN